jgi:hypothetical protein
VAVVVVVVALGMTRDNAYLPRPIYHLSSISSPIEDVLYGQCTPNPIDRWSAKQMHRDRFGRIKKNRKQRGEELGYIKPSVSK